MATFWPSLAGFRHPDNVLVIGTALLPLPILKNFPSGPGEVALERFADTAREQVKRSSAFRPIFGTFISQLRWGECERFAGIPVNSGKSIRMSGSPTGFETRVYRRKTVT